MADVTTSPCDRREGPTQSEIWQQDVSSICITDENQPLPLC